MTIANALLCFLPLLLLSQPTGALAGGARRLTVQARDVCRTVASLRLVVVEGTCEGTATASCDVVLERLDMIGGQFKEWWADGGVCDDGKADVAVENISNVLANIWLETAVQVKCAGVGFACGWTAIEAPAWFDSVGDALDLVAAESGAKEAQFCAPDMRSITKDVDVDVETRRKEVCATGGVEGELRNVVKSIFTKALKSVFIRATSGVCSRDIETSCPASTPDSTTELSKTEADKAAPEEAPGSSEDDTSGTPETTEDQYPQETPQTSEDTEDTEPEQPVESTPAETETSEANEDALAAVDTFDILGNPDLGGIVIGSVDGTDETVINEKTSGTSTTPNEDEAGCQCPTELCAEGATCRAVPLAQCKTVPKDGDCDNCEAKFFVDYEEVSCSVDFCTASGSVCVSNALAKCCGVCCRCDTFFNKFKAFGTLEIGFCQEGPVCDCLSVSDKHVGG